MDFKGFVIFIACFTKIAASQSGLRLLFPEPQKMYIYVVKTNISTSTLMPRESGSQWNLEGKLFIQAYENYTKARLRLDGLKRPGYGLDALDVEDKYITDPWELEYLDDGSISTIYVGIEPVWSTNFKRALSVNFQLTKKHEMAYTISEPCLDNICENIYNVKDNTYKKFTHLKIATTAGSSNSWSSVPWASEYSGPPIIDSIQSVERTYEMDENKGLMSLELKGCYQYKTYDHILAVTSGLSLLYDADIPGKTVEKLNLTHAPLQYVASDYDDPTNGITNLTQGFLRNKTYKLLLKISNGIDADNIVRDPTAIHSLDYIDLLNTLSRLSYDTLINIFQDLVLGTSYDLETSRNIFLEVLPHARSEACAKFIKYLVLEEKENIEDAALLSLVRKLPFNIAKYSQRLLEELESFSKLGLDFTPDIRHAGILSFATLVHKTVELAHVKQDYLDKIVVKYFRMYNDCPQYLDRMIWLQGLCNIGYSADSYTRIIFAGIGKNRYERLWAALGGGSKSGDSFISPKRKEIYSVLHSIIPVLTNDSEHISLRIIALHQFLISPEIRASDFMYVHNYIRSCSNKQLKRFWYTTVKNLEANRHFSGYEIASFFVPFISNQVTNPDLLHLATNNYIISGREDAGSPWLQVLTIGDSLGTWPPFIGARLSTGGRRPYKAAVYLIVEEVSNYMQMHLLNRMWNLQDVKIEKLVELLKSMKTWRIKSSPKIHIDIVVKIQDKTVFATHMNQSRFDSLKVEDFEYIKDFLRFGSHINQQIVYYPFQSDLHIPTELGTPIRLQSTVASFTSIRGNITSLSTHDLAWRNDLHIRYQGTSVTSLTTDAPIVRSIHTARIQQSLVAHLPMKFNVSSSLADKSLQVTWLNPTAQQGGVAMHSRVQIEMENQNKRHNYTVTLRDNGFESDNESGFFFDCEHPLTSSEIYDRLLSPNINNYETRNFQPSLVILNTIILFTSPPPGSCGLILSPQRQVHTAEDALLIKFQIKPHSLENEKLKEFYSFLLNYYRVGNPGKAYLKVEALVQVERNKHGDVNLEVSVLGQQPIMANTSGREWTICLQKGESNQQITNKSMYMYTNGFEGQMTLTYGGNRDRCFQRDPEVQLRLKHKGIPQKEPGTFARVYEVHLVGKNLSSLPVMDIEPSDEESLEQLLAGYHANPLQVSAIIKEKNGEASLTVNKSPEKPFKYDNFGWILDTWTGLQIMKTLAMYRECSIKNSSVHTIWGAEEQLPPGQCKESIALADCSSNEPKFAVVHLADGIHVYTGDYSVSIRDVQGETIVDIDEKKPQLFGVTKNGDIVKVISYLMDLQVYYRKKEIVILVPRLFQHTVCGFCSSVEDIIQKKSCHYP